MKTLLKHALRILPMVMAAHTSLQGFDPVIPCGGCDCTMTVDWRLPVDLDGDDVPDFDHIRLRTEKNCRDGVWWMWQSDEIEAFYPEAHVDLYVYYNSRIVTRYRAALDPGQVIAPDPNPDCSWPAEDCWDWVSRVPDAQRILQAEGLGIIERETELPDCLQGGCGYTMHGVLRPDDPSDWSPWQVLALALTGS